MRLGILCNPYHRGGITRWIVDFAGAWRRAGGECWFVVPRPRTPFVTGAGRPTVLDLLATLPPDAQPNIVAPEVGAEFELGTEAYRADVLYSAAMAHLPAGVAITVTDDPAAWSAAAALAHRNPFIGALHADEDVYYALARRHAPALAAVACVSRRIETGARAIPSLGRARIATIPCGTPEGRAPTPDSSGEVLRLLWVGRMVEGQKRVSDLPKIAAALAAAGVRYELRIVGDGEDRESVESLSRELGVAPFVRLLGWRSAREVASALGESDLLLQPSNFEGMSVALMEALAAGCGVVASRVSGVEDYEGHPLAEGCLWVHPVGDVQAAAAAVARAARYPRAERARRARELHHAEFSLGRCVERYRALAEGLTPALTRSAAPSALRRRMAALASYPVAAQRAARLWARRRLGNRRAAVAAPPATLITRES